MIHSETCVIFRRRQEMSRGVLSLRFNQDHGKDYLWCLEIIWTIYECRDMSLLPF